MLTVSLDAFERYQRQEAWTWEHMALCRARPVFGSVPVREEAAALIADILRMPRDFDNVASDATRMRADIQRHKPPRGPLDVKLGPGGLVDLEFAVHVLQLTTHVGLSTRLEEALEQLSAESLVPANIVGALKLLSRMLVMMRLVAPGGCEARAGDVGAGRASLRRRELERAACRARCRAAERRGAMEWHQARGVT